MKNSMISKHSSRSKSKIREKVLKGLMRQYYMIPLSVREIYRIETSTFTIVASVCI